MHVWLKTKTVLTGLRASKAVAAVDISVHTIGVVTMQEDIFRVFVFTIRLVRFWINTLWLTEH